jgi:hypothetical protein
MTKQSKNTKVPQCDKTAVMRCCSNCQFYRHEEVGDSDFGAIYAYEASCSEYLDTDDEEKVISGFDRSVERECCALDFFKIIEIDEDLNKSFHKELNKGDSFNKTYKRFCEKYNIA